MRITKVKNLFVVFLFTITLLMGFSFAIGEEKEPEILKSQAIGNWIDYREQYSGSGTSEDPYIIDSEGKLAQLSYETSAYGDITTSYYRMTKSLFMGAHYFNPISSGGRFRGFFDGNGCIIYDLTIQNDGYAGLFDNVIDAEIQIIGLVNPIIQCVYDDPTAIAGGIAGQATNSRVDACFVIGGQIKNNGQEAAGIVGRAIGTTEIYSCFIRNVQIVASLKNAGITLGEPGISIYNAYVCSSAVKFGISESGKANNCFYSSSLSSGIGSYRPAAEIKNTYISWNLKTDEKINDGYPYIIFYYWQDINNI